MTSPTHGDGPDGRRTDPTDDDSGSRAVSAEPADDAGGAATGAGRTGAGSSGTGSTGAQASGKQFERGTEAVPDHDPETGTGGLGPGASASGKRFARGTDSDGDGVAYDEEPRSTT